MSPVLITRFKNELALSVFNLIILKSRRCEQFGAQSPSLSIGSLISEHDSSCKRKVGNNSVSFDCGLGHHFQNVLKLCIGPQRNLVSLRNAEKQNCDAKSDKRFEFFRLNREPEMRE